MTLTRAGRVGGIVAFVTLLTVAFFMGNQRLAFADPGDIPTDPLPNECSDGIDNDGDGLMDFVPLFGDPGCDDIFDASEGSGGGGGGSGPIPSESPACSDGIDNDNDGLIDWAPNNGGDPDCGTPTSDSESPAPGGGGSTPACSDGVDNDNDGKVDSVDPGCSSAEDTDETDPTGGGDGGSNPGGGNSGGAARACEDSIDNDGDSLIDMNDPGCSEPGDTDESSGGSGGGGGGGSSTAAATSTGEVLGTSTTTEAVAACDTYLTAFIRFGGKNDTEQVSRLQKVLKDFEGASVEENGSYDRATLDAVHAFQTKYADEILKPWGIAKSTGFVYLTTRKKINEIRCENKETFPLTEEEQKKIEEAKGETSSMVAVVTAAVVKPAAIEAETKDKEEAKKDTSQAKTGSKSEEVEESGIRKVWDFLGRLFNRGR
ncbi:hypothetical protein HY969_04665 [Candidatus Kaiserbacteria bacterium]|nr:hypothetical protein [Candidatus Kaiserbacteria bacterium]